MYLYLIHITRTQYPRPSHPRHAEHSTLVVVITLYHLYVLCILLLAAVLVLCVCHNRLNAFRHLTFQFVVFWRCPFFLLIQHPSEFIFLTFAHLFSNLCQCISLTNNFVYLPFSFKSQRLRSHGYHTPTKNEGFFSFYVSLCVYAKLCVGFDAMIRWLWIFFSSILFLVLIHWMVAISCIAQMRANNGINLSDVFNGNQLSPLQFRGENYRQFNNPFGIWRNENCERFLDSVFGASVPTYLRHTKWQMFVLLKYCNDGNNNNNGHHTKAKR